MRKQQGLFEVAGTGDENIEDWIATQQEFSILTCWYNFLQKKR